jgi:hypothetical protein
MAMRRLIILAAAAASGGAPMLPAPALAQAGPMTNQITVYGNDPCPRSTESQVYVCNRRPEAERYRLPQDQRLQGTRQQRESWAQKSQVLTTVGNTGPGSCSAVGPGGFTGCLTQQINQARKESREQSAQDQPPQ